MDYMQILCHLHKGGELQIWVSAGFLEPTPLGARSPWGTTVYDTVPVKGQQRVWAIERPVLSAAYHRSIVSYLEPLAIVLQSLLLLF